MNCKLTQCKKINSDPSKNLIGSSICCGFLQWVGYKIVIVLIIGPKLNSTCSKR